MSKRETRAVRAERPSGMPLIGGVISVLGTIAVVVVWAASTISFDLIFHFHPFFIGAIAGWGLRLVLGPGLSAARVGWILSLAVAGAVGGQLLIEAYEGPIDPLGVVMVVALAGAGVGVYITSRPGRGREEENEGGRSPR